jgi:hypothetical protein
MNVNRGSCRIVIQHGWHDIVKCPTNYVVVGRAASGRNADASYGGRRYPTYMKCCLATSPPKMRVL